MNLNRRTFITSSLAASVAAIAPRLSAQENNKSSAGPAVKPLAELPRGERQNLDLVFEFVRAGHTNLPRVKELVAQDPKLVLASWDWGQGDWETALGGASHIGNREMALYLLSQGARIDVFCAAMLGRHEAVSALLAADPATARTRGPHGFTLLYHVAISGDVLLAEALQPHLAPEPNDYNQALHSAARHGHKAMTSWLLANGVNNPNTRDSAFKKTPLATALAKGFSEVVEELRRHGGRE